jgi:hypothetical protein
MPFDIQNLHIEQHSREGQKRQAIIQRDHVSPEEAIRRALRHPAVVDKTPGQELIGLFSSDEDRALIDEVMEMARERRKLDEPRDFGI